tara:strand:+ start:758 stop:1066 length:309 start_codon:yes stop_codon:yes gene_type:complete
MVEVVVEHIILQALLADLVVQVVVVLDNLLQQEEIQYHHPQLDHLLGALTMVMVVELLCLPILTVVEVVVALEALVKQELQLMVVMVVKELELPQFHGCHHK